MGRARGKHNDRTPVITPDSGEGRETGMSARMAEGGPEGKDKSPIPGGISHLGNAPTVRQHAAVSDQAPREYEGMMAHGVAPPDHTTAERAEAERGPNTAHDPQPRYLPAPKKPGAVPVQIVQARKIRSVATSSYTIPAAGSAAARIAGRDYTRTHILLLVETAAGSTSVSNPTPSQPSVPATGVAQQNVNGYPVQVVISANGATITNVTVNGVTVGTAAGTYTVPAFGSISIAYSVATPTWVWSYAPGNPNVLVSSAAPSGIRFDHEVSELDVGKGSLLPAGHGSYLRLSCNDELFAVSNDGSACTLSVIYLYGIAETS